MKRSGGCAPILACPVGLNETQFRPGIPDLTYASLEFKYGRSSLVDAHMATFAATLMACKVSQVVTTQGHKHALLKGVWSRGPMCKSLIGAQEAKRDQGPLSPANGH